MSVFKGLNRSDVYLTDYNSKKWWSVPGTCLSQLGIKILKGTEKPPFYCSQPEDTHTVFGPVTGTVGVTSSYETGSYNEVAVFGSIRELYYSSQPEDVPRTIKVYDITGSVRIEPNNPRSVLNGSASYATELYPQSTLTVSGSRVLSSRTYRDPADTNLPDHQLDHRGPGVAVISIPRDVIGTGISPGTFRANLDEDNQCYLEDGYIDGEYDPVSQECNCSDTCAYSSGSWESSGYPIGRYSKTTPEGNWVDPYFENLHTGPVIDYEGVVLYSGFIGTWDIVDDMVYPTPRREKYRAVGDIIYTHGNIIFTNEFLRFLFTQWDAENYSWQSNYPRFTKHFTCKVQDVDYNYTLNPTAPVDLQITQGFTPYVTSLGLYNEEGELLAVAKLSKPIKKPSDTDMTFDIQIDLG